MNFWRRYKYNLYVRLFVVKILMLVTIFEIATFYSLRHWHKFNLLKIIGLGQPDVFIRIRLVTYFDDITWYQHMICHISYVTNIEKTSTTWSYLMISLYLNFYFEIVLIHVNNWNSKPTTNSWTNQMLTSRIQDTWNNMA